MISYLCAGRHPAKYLSPHLPPALGEKVAAFNNTLNIGDAAGIVESCQPGLWDLIQRTLLHLCVAEARASATLMVMWWIDIQERSRFWKLNASGYWLSQAWRSSLTALSRRNWVQRADLQSRVLVTRTFLASDVQLWHLNLPSVCPVEPGCTYKHKASGWTFMGYSCNILKPVDDQSTAQNPGSCINTAHNDIRFITPYISSPSSPIKWYIRKCIVLSISWALHLLRDLAWWFSATPLWWSSTSMAALSSCSPSPPPSHLPTVT